ncbi:hypothetical protein LTS10_011257 [Elasticomyces elasticus]|nr:hypothetical protein LTS10_011257 [Elasticomyces elasticus]
MPRRMVEATSDGQRSSFRVKDTYPDHVEPYAALSYCWGGDQTFKTTKAKLEHFRNGRAASVLTRTISDALITTMRLGLRYIWVDSLCVIQDDEKDKACEVAQMAKINANATVTIVASRAQTAWDDFLGARPPLGARKPHAVFRLPCEAPNGLRSEIVLVGEEYEAVEPVEERGWTYQERVVSPRTLEFGTKRTFWSCSTLDNSSIAPSDGWSSETPHDMDRYRRVDRSTLAVMIAGGYTQSETCLLRHKLVAGFTARSLSFVDDRLPAIAAVTQRLVTHLRTRYLAGLWQSDFPFALLWEQYGSPLPRPPANTVTAPSWSWASIAGAVRYDATWCTDFNFTWDVDVVDCDVQLADAVSPYGKVTGGTLTLKAPWRSAQLRPREDVRGNVDCELWTNRAHADDSWDTNSPSTLPYFPESTKRPLLELEVIVLLLGVHTPNSTWFVHGITGLVLRPLPTKDHYTRIEPKTRTLWTAMQHGSALLVSELST